MEAILTTYYENNAQKLHTMVDKILFKLKFTDVDNEDFYSLANEIFAGVLKGYDGKQDFNGFLYTCLCNKFKTEMTRRNREKRKADKMSLSLDSPIGEDENLKLEDIIADKNTIEKEFFEETEECYSKKMCKYLERLSELQQEVLRLISIGFMPNEIMKELHISNDTYNDCLMAIRSDRNKKILL